MEILGLDIYNREIDVWHLYTYDPKRKTYYRIFVTHGECRVDKLLDKPAPLLIPQRPITRVYIKCGECGVDTHEFISIDHGCRGCMNYIFGTNRVLKNILTDVVIEGVLGDDPEIKRIIDVKPYTSVFTDLFIRKKLKKNGKVGRVHRHK
jgi:hypothetical protein